MWPPACDQFVVSSFVLIRSDQNLTPRKYELVATFTFEKKKGLPSEEYACEDATP
ncbi:MAG: hypothetical protein NT045_06375 [Candidatus Aureabacteria bacterium]|nr:hypothetical protein [Candidatus Auribacterota bacterium]